MPQQQTSQTFGRVTVRTFPLPPRGFHPMSASPAQLEQHGFPRRPDPDREPHIAARWIAAFGKYPQLRHTTPKFRALEHRHAPNQRTQKGTQGHLNATSANWSGSVLLVGSGDAFSWISGSWTVPHAYAAPGGGGQYSSAWLGIDGDESPDVMQAGTESDPDGTCYAWFEWFPNFSIAIDDFPVAPGDVVSLLLCATAPNTAWMSIGNLTSLQYTNFSFTAPDGTVLTGNSAEAVVERPEVNGQLATLPRYGEVFFDDTVAYTAGGQVCPIGLGTPISMVANDGVTVISSPTFEADTDSIKLSYSGG
jgi:hypothetical protein